MPLRRNLPAALLALAVALPGAALAGVAIEEQRSVLLDCKRDRSVPGAAWFNQARGSASSTRMLVQIVPYDRVTAEDASAINACAEGRLGLGPALSPGRAATSRTVVKSIRAPAGYKGVDCGRNPSILYRGDLYCQRR